ncbi:uncharacterized protein LOC121992487 [Zingiber officinale]|uniref:uncharacterized protein LOC121992487 n=1 Tax=Zingiber officinale TaxID=94328 RepID=UPI001C4C0A20|nr:uncharacterized protein LOC121992487 [Zingiber officinale]
MLLIMQRLERIFQLLDRFVERVGEVNVVQVVTDSASNNVLVEKLLEAKRPHLYWTPCAAHCVDLILEDIGKLPDFKATLKKAMSMNAYIYVRPGMVNMLRQFTRQKELCWAGITRFATTFLTLERMHLQKQNLRKMFISKDWTESKWVKEAAGKKVAKIIMILKFWSSIVHILKIYFKNIWPFSPCSETG